MSSSQLYPNSPNKGNDFSSSSSSSVLEDTFSQKTSNSQKSNKGKKNTSYRRVTLNDRIRMIALREANHSITEIAKILNFNKSTVSRELRRLDSGACSLFSKYDEYEAQKDADKKRKNCGAKFVVTGDDVEKIKSGLKQHLSPEQMAGSHYEGLNMSYVTIYQAIERIEELREVATKYLLRKYRKTKKSHSGPATRYQTGQSIHTRPQEVNNREEFGHWEADTIESRHGGTCCLFVLVERVTRKVYVKLASEFTAREMTKFILSLFNHLPKGAMKSITCDRGKEFAYFKEIEDKTGIDVYFADPHSPNQKGTVENSNGFIRRFFKKGTDFGQHTQREVYWTAIYSLNNNPRKILNWTTSSAAFASEVRKLSKNCS